MYPDLLKYKICRCLIYLLAGYQPRAKSFLAKRIAEKTKAFHLDLDTLRDEMAGDPKIEPWVSFYWNQDEKKYLTETSCEEKWLNLVKQSEAFWPFFLNKIEEIKKTHKSAIFEAVNILPHLASRDLDFPGIFLLGQSFEQIFERIKLGPRWGDAEELQRLEAETFFNCERENYKSKADKYGFKTFTNSKEAEQEALRLLKSNL